MTDFFIRHPNVALAVCVAWVVFVVVVLSVNAARGVRHERQSGDY